MGNRPLKPVIEPGQVTHLADAETSSVLSKRFDSLARRSGPDRSVFTVEDLIALDTGFTTKWGVPLVERLFDTMDLDGSKSVSRDGFIAAAYCAACGSQETRTKLIFNMFDVSHRGELTEADFTSVYGEVCKAGIEPPRAYSVGSSTTARASTASTVATSADGTEEMLATLATVAGKGIHGYYDTTGKSRLSFAEFSGLMKQDGRIQVLRMDVSALLAPGLLG